MSDPRKALDYPDLNDHVWIIWSGNEFKWPEARRRTHYLSRLDRDVMDGWALFTPHWQNAATFADEATAQRFHTENEEKRLVPYESLRITTVADMKRERGYA